MENIPVEIIKVAKEENMNPLDLLRNISGTLRTVTVTETAKIYEISCECVIAIKENDFVKDVKEFSKELVDAKM